MTHRFKSVRALALAGTLALLAAPALAEVAKPSSVDLLFEAKHLLNVNAGTDLAYKFERTVTHPEVMGQSFSDEIHIDVKKAATDAQRNVVIKVFTGDRARDPQPIEGLTGNPLLVVFLDRAVSSYMAVAGGKLPYLKDKFRTALRERTTIEPVKVTYDGKTVEGQRVTVIPFATDLNASKMRGYENAKFSIVVAEAVPGRFVEMTAAYPNTSKEAPYLEETTKFVGAEVQK